MTMKVDVQTFLGFDVGTKKTGVAVANSLTHNAQGIQTVQHHKDGSTNWGVINHLIEQYMPNVFIVGLPLYGDQREDKQTKEMLYIAQSFGKKLAQKYHKTVYYIDESLSSYEAKLELKWQYSHKNANRLEVDKRASALILQTWLNENTIN